MSTISENAGNLTEGGTGGLCPLGWKKDAIDHRDYILQTPLTKDIITKIDLRPNCPPVYDQGNLGSCVSNGTSFGVQYDQKKYNMTHQFNPSRLYIYYNTRVIEGTVNEDSGTTIRNALVSLNKQGACPETIWPYTISKYSTKPSTQSYQSGAQHLVSSYSRVVFDLVSMKQCLIDGFPFVFGILLYSQFESVGINGLVSSPTGSDTMLGGHCMACVGFDDLTRRFTVRNSWGSTWGDHGYCYIPYDYICNPSYTFDLWTIRTITDTENTTTTITKVTYGKGTKVKDVTNIFKSYFTPTRTTMLIGNKLFGDPAFKIVKELRITYSNGTVLVFAENKTITQNDVTPKTTKTVKISTATYGIGTSQMDVTVFVKNQVSQGISRLVVENSTFGPDPCPSVVKELRVILLDNTVKIYPEHATVTLSDFL